MICRLCLKPSDDGICIFDEVGQELGVARVLEKHFWFRPKADDPISTVICDTCWLTVISFHEFYEGIEEAHRLLTERFSLTAEPAPSKVECLDTESDNEYAEIKVYVEGDNEVMLPDITPVEILEEHLEEADVKETIDKDESYDESMLVDTSGSVPSDEKDSLEDTGPPLRRSRRTAGNSVDPIEEAKETVEVKTEIAQSPVARKRGRPRKNPLESTLSKTPPTTQKNAEKSPTSSQDSAKKSRQAQREAKDEATYVRKMREIDEMIASYLKLYCDICNQEQANFALLSQHMHRVHKSKAYAICCNRKFRKRVYLADHIKRHLNPDYFKCTECDKVFSDKQCMRNHILVKHQPEEKKVFACPQCPKKYAKAYLLEQHRVQHDERIHKCEICDRGFPSQSILSSHIKVVHGQYGIMCDICAKVIRGPGAFARHQLEHQGVALPKIQCDICGSWHKDKYSLQKHKRRHNDDGVRYVCSECGKVAPNRTALVSHKRNVHEAKRVHECSVCQKAFKKPINLKEHMTIHTGEVLYSCPHCPKTFNSNANMHSHRKKMHPVEFEEARRKRRFENPAVLATNDKDKTAAKAAKDQAILVTISNSDDDESQLVLVTTSDND